MRNYKNLHAIAEILKLIYHSVSDFQKSLLVSSAEVQA